MDNQLPRLGYRGRYADEKAFFDGILLYIHRAWGVRLGHGQPYTIETWQNG